MKKVVFISLISFLTLAPATMMGQQKASTKTAAKPKAMVAPVIKTMADSISYVYGVALVESLPMHLTQIGVLADTAMVAAEYKSKIDAEADQTKKAQLVAQSKAKVDSIAKANKTNMIDFIAGFKQAMLGNNKSKAFNSGIAIASQVGTMSENFAKQVLGTEDGINKTAFLSAFVTSLNNEKPLITIDNPQAFIEQKAQAAQQRKEIEDAEKLHSQYADQIAAGKKFFAENKTKEGVVALPDGLQYKVITMGTGKKPSATDMVKVHYKGTLLDGTPFDSSYDRGEPASFGVGQVIKGWTEALQLMPAGSKWALYIPYDLAYGSRDQGVIKPFSDLVFEVELLEVIEVADVHGTND